MPLHVSIDRDLCIGSGKCASDSPSAFSLDDYEIAQVLPGAADLPDERLIVIARRCPVSAIVLHDESGTEVDPLA